MTTTTEWMEFLAWPTPSMTSIMWFAQSTWELHSRSPSCFSSVGWLEQVDVALLIRTVWLANQWDHMLSSSSSSSSFSSISRGHVLETQRWGMNLITLSCGNHTCSELHWFFCTQIWGRESTSCPSDCPPLSQCMTSKVQGQPPPSAYMQRTGVIVWWLVAACSQAGHETMRTLLIVSLAGSMADTLIPPRGQAIKQSFGR